MYSYIEHSRLGSNTKIWATCSDFHTTFGCYCHPTNSRFHGAYSASWRGGCRAIVASWVFVLVLYPHRPQARRLVTCSPVESVAVGLVDVRQVVSLLTDMRHRYSAQGILSRCSRIVQITEGVQCGGVLATIHTDPMYGSEHVHVPTMTLPSAIPFNPLFVKATQMPTPLERRVYCMVAR